MNKNNPFSFTGLTQNEVNASRKKYGKNIIEVKSAGAFWHSLKEAVTEPMFILLVAAAAIYFILGEFSDAWFMSAAPLYWCLPFLFSRTTEAAMH